MNLYKLFKLNYSAIIISPSGNLYGSEKVLMDFLQYSKNQYVVFVPQQSILYNEISHSETYAHHYFLTFKSIPALYLTIAIVLLLKKRNLYLNEGAHIKYAQVLSKLLPHRKVSTHIRIIEDCNRINNLSKNHQLITISKFLASKIPLRDTSIIYDPFPIELTTERLIASLNLQGITIGIVGRITRSKGIENIFPILDIFEKNPINKLKILFFGSYNSLDVYTSTFLNRLKSYTKTECQVVGFVKTPWEIYNNLDVVIHLNQNEPLGRIVFESISFHKPIITFEEGGTGELMNHLKLSAFTVDRSNTNWPAKFADLILTTSKRPLSPMISEAQEIIKKEHSPKEYVKKIEQLIL